MGRTASSRLTRAAGTALALLAAGVLSADPAAPPPPPPASQPAEPGLGRIVGQFAPPGCLREATCLDREANMNYLVRLDAASGRFRVERLAPGRRYDLEATATDGRVFRGVDLSYEEDPLLRLAAEQVGERPENPGPLTDADRRQIDDIVVKIETFEDSRRILALRGDHARAAALVELRRTRPFHSGKPGEQIRRVEIWHFKFQHGGWEKAANAEKVLSRVRASADRVARLIEREVYMPELGGLLVEAGKETTLEVTLPGFPPPPATQSE